MERITEACFDEVITKYIKMTLTLPGLKSILILCVLAYRIKKHMNIHDALIIKSISPAEHSLHCEVTTLATLILVNTNACNKIFVKVFIFQVAES